MNTRILLIAFLAAATLAAAATPARAGSYVVVGCSDLGRHTPRPADGWNLTAGVYPSRNDCRSGGGLYATGDREPNLFRFDAPAGTTISRLVVAYRAHLSGAAAWAVPTMVVSAGHSG